ncbi:MAG: hypothetical protein WCP07_09820, partial [bacterium]
MQVQLDRLLVYEVIVPLRPNVVSSPEFADRNPWWEMPICVLEAEFSDGITAWGEANRSQTIASLEPWLRQMPGLKPVGGSLRGMPDAWRGEGVYGVSMEERFPPSLYASPSPLTNALETILLDWAGKKIGCRAADILGGAVRERVAVDYWCGRQNLDGLRRTVQRARE